MQRNLMISNLVNKLGKSLNRQVSVMNIHGCVLASTSDERIGEFSSGAYESIKKRGPVFIRTEPDGSSKPCVYFPIYEEGEISGAVEVEGESEEAQEIAKTIKVALELLTEDIRRNEPFRDLFRGDLARALLCPSANKAQLIRHVVQKYKFMDNQARLPILAQMGMAQECGRLKKELFQQYQTLDIYHPQDILLELDDERILLFKFLPDLAINCKFLADEVASRLDEFFLRLDPKTKVDNIYYFYGPIQLRFSDYERVYQDICWMERHLRVKLKHINRFSDYLPEFLLKSIPEETLKPIFDASIHRIEKLWDIQLFVETISALISANMKLEATAQMLFLHKNTVVFRLNKIKEVLGLDPINNIRDTNYLIMLYSYWKYYYEK